MRGETSAKDVWHSVALPVMTRLAARRRGDRVCFYLVIKICCCGRFLTWVPLFAGYTQLPAAGSARLRRISTTLDTRLPRVRLWFGAFCLSLCLRSIILSRKSEYSLLVLRRRHSNIPSEVLLTDSTAKNVWKSSNSSIPLIDLGKNALLFSC